MPDLRQWIPPGPIAFAMILCTAMVAGEIFSGDTQNPASLVFYSFLPAVLWMLANQQRRNASEIRNLRARLDLMDHPGRSSVNSE